VKIVKYSLIAVILITVLVGAYMVYVTINAEKNIIEFDSNLATETNDVVSPSGQYKLQIKTTEEDGIKFNFFVIAKMEISEDKYNVVFESNDKFRVRDRLYFLWGNDDSVWVYSGDLGTFYWTKASNDTWIKHSYSDNKDVPVPDLLKQLKPNYFD